MVARASSAQVAQFGVETTAGVAVACNKRLVGTQISLKPEFGINFYRSTGAKVPSVGVLNQISSTGTFNGPLMFSEIIFYLAGYTTLVSSTQIGTTGGYTHLFQPVTTGNETRKTFTIQKGDASAAQQVAGAVINSLQLSLTRQECTVSGGLIATELDNGATLTSSPTVLSNVPVTGNVWSVYLNSTFGTIGTTKLTDCFRVTISFPEKYRPKWVLDSSLTSWKEAVEIPTEPTVTIVCEYSTQMQALYDALTASGLPTYYMRVKAVGAVISGAASYLEQFDFALKLKDATSEDDVEGIVYGYTFTFQVVDDATMGRPWSASIVNQIAAVS